MYKMYILFLNRYKVLKRKTYLRAFKLKLQLALDDSNSVLKNCVCVNNVIVIIFQKYQLFINNKAIKPTIYGSYLVIFIY